ncbi:polysaccharide deacetylase family protein [Clostridium estertheticum]|nr:polysaccharide deacetylase family protein [Clostridium estertheticum]MBX4270785.1 polysaccharide deacetylase family protein [Clostridium estertheticum]WLC78719.1 polysaccharide deacetylase family protein [Clostridium estertheticum]WLC89741.1 polysaccharide deacetylase family protein [Clostridium estertheticum]
MGSIMRLHKRFLIITIAILIGSIGLLYKYSGLVIHKEKNSKTTINTTKTLKTPSVKTVFIHKSVDSLENKKIPILMYHSISYEKENILRVPKEKFRNQMKYLKDNNYTTLTLDELYSYMKTGKDLPSKPIVITFDDGYKDNYTNAYPILKEFKLKATIFVITNTIDHEKDYLTSAEIKLMDSNNIRIESHTSSHEHLDQISYVDNVNTMKTSKIKLEKILNKKIDYIAYPYGGYTPNTIKAAKQSGYKLAFSTEFGLIDKSDNIYSLGRIFVNSNFSLEEFKVKLTS